MLIPLFIVPARLVGRKLQRLTRESMQLDAAMGSTMTERFNVAGAMLVKLFGRPDEEADVFGDRAGRVRDIGVQTAMYGSSLFVALTLLASLATAVVYGLGGALVIDNFFKIGTLVALAALISRLYGPITSLSNVQVDVMTALVSFDRVFEVLDLKPLIEDAPGGATARGRARRARHRLRARRRSGIRRQPRSRLPRSSRSRCPSRSAPRPTPTCCATSASMPRRAS